MQFTDTAKHLLDTRYFLHSKDNEPLEDWNGLCDRVCNNISRPERNKKLYNTVYEQSYKLINSTKFLPNSPTLMGAGLNNLTLSGCFIIDVNDSMVSIKKALCDAIDITKAGGGFGLNFSRIRPMNSFVGVRNGVASGPVSFLQMFDALIASMKQGGARKGAMMANLNVTHPDIIEFINCKQDINKLTNMNISIIATDAFMNAVKQDKDWLLYFNNKKINMKAREIWNQICHNAWLTGDPGIMFITTANRYNTIKDVGKIRGSNPCLPDDTWIQTTDGPRQIKELIEKPFTALIEGKEYKCISNGFFHTGKKMVYEIETQCGITLKATDNHNIYCNDGQKKRVDELIINQDFLDIDNQKYEWKGQHNFDIGYLIGSIYGDGSITTYKRYGTCMDIWDKDGESIDMFEKIKSIIKEIDTKKYKRIINPINVGNGYNKYRISSSETYKIISSLGVVDKKIITKEMEKCSSDFYKGFISGFIDTDGTIQENKIKGNYIRISSINLNNIKILQKMLKRLGITSSIYKNRKNNNNISLLPDGKGNIKEYNTQQYHELQISVMSEIQKINNVIRLFHRDKKTKLNNIIKSYKKSNYNVINKKYLVKSITPISEQDVYNCTIDEIHKFVANGIIVANCSEVQLPPYSSCNLGSIDISKYLDSNNKIKEKELSEDIYWAVRILDNIIDINYFPTDEISRTTKDIRPIGLGIMGFADYLLHNKIDYASEEAVNEARKIGQLLKSTAIEASIKLGEEKGNFSRYDKSTFYKDNPNGYMRNCQTTSIAPTGTLSLLANCSSGIEPYFTYTTMKRGTCEGKNIDIGANKWVWEDENRPSYAKEAIEIPWEYHIKIQAAFQESIDSGVSKSVNLPVTATEQDVSDVYMTAWMLGCKGTTVFRQGCPKDSLFVCPECSNKLIVEGKCTKCSKCTWTKCNL